MTQPNVSEACKESTKCHYNTIKAVLDIVLARKLVYHVQNFLNVVDFVSNFIKQLEHLLFEFSDLFQWFIMFTMEDEIPCSITSKTLCSAAHVAEFKFSLATYLIIGIECIGLVNLQ